MQKILCVDDDPNVLEGYQRNLRKRFDLTIAKSGAEALEAIRRQGPFAVLVADMQMPEMDGLHLLIEAARLAPDTVRIMLTGNADQKTAVDAVNSGRVFRFLTKPCPMDQLGTTLQEAAQQHELLMVEKDLMERTLNSLVGTFMRLLTAVDPKTFGTPHQCRDYIRRLGAAVGISRLWELETAAMLARLGVLTLAPQILLKLRSNLPLSAAEQAQYARVPEISQGLLAGIPRLQEVSMMVAYHQKNYDGTGFPSEGLTGESIPLGARLIRIVQDLMALRERGLDTTTALDRMRSRIGFYDPTLLAAAVGCFARPALATDGTEDTLAVSFQELRVGDTVVADVEGKDGSLLLMSGEVVTESAWKRMDTCAELVGIHEPVLIRKEVKTAK